MLAASSCYIPPQRCADSRRQRPAEELLNVAKTKTAASTKAAAKTTRTKAAAKPVAKKPLAKKAVAKKAKAPAKKTAAKKADKLGEEEVKLDRRRAEQRAEESAAETVIAEEAAEPAPKLERREKVNRRRQIDPTTCERDYSDQEVEFMNALDAYKRSSGRMFPTCSEVLEVIRGMGYVQLNPAELATIKTGRGETELPTDLEASVELDAEEAFAESEELHVD